MSARASRPPGRRTPEGLGEDGGLVGGQVDHPVGDDHIDGGVGHRQPFDVSVQESEVLKVCRGAQPLGLGGLRVGHVDARSASALPISKW